MMNKETGGEMRLEVRTGGGKSSQKPTDLRSACFLLTAPYRAYHRPISRPFRCGGGRSLGPLAPPWSSWSKELEPPLSHLSLLLSLCPRPPPLLPLLPPPPANRELILFATTNVAIVF